MSKFDIEITKEKRYDDDEQEYKLATTHNGNQWTSLTFTKDELYELSNRLHDFLGEIADDTQIP